MTVENPRRSLIGSVRDWAIGAVSRPEVSVLVAAVLLGTAFAVNSPSFLGTFNVFNVSRTAAIYVWIALAQAMVLVVGGMNLSIGQIGGLTVVVAGYLLDVQAAPIWLAVGCGLLTGVVAGVLNGLLITWLRINAFVVTLATSFVFQGLINGVTRGYPYTKIPAGFGLLGTGGVGPLPWLLVCSVAVLVVLGYFYHFTVTGRGLLATGGNLMAARLSGISTDRMIVVAHVLSGVLASGAGLLWISRTGSAQPATGGDWMVISFAVAVIGGTALVGGAVNMAGILFAAFLLAMVNNGLVMLNANVYYEQTYMGIILLLAVSIPTLRAVIGDRMARRRQTSARTSPAAQRQAELSTQKEGNQE
jgi:ribose transport system permease protein